MSQQKKVLNRTQVYRAVYYSGFEWSRTVAIEDTYKLTCKETNHIITMKHTHDDEMKMDFLIVESHDNLNDKELARFSRMCHKIMRRTRDLGIKQDLIELCEQQTATTEGTNEEGTND